MELEFRPDFEEVRGRWEKFWRGEADRPMVNSVKAKDGVDPIPAPRPYSCVGGDIDAMVDQTLGWASTHEFLADSIPSFLVTFAPDHFAALLGAEIVDGMKDGTGTNWVEPCLESLDDVEIKFDREGKWWKRTLECIEKFRAKCDGKLLIAGTHFQGSLDCLVAMYGTQELLMDMAIAPEKVHAALVQVDAAMAEARAAMSEALDMPKWGSLNRWGMYSPGTIDVPQCDVSCMISTEMFDAFELPSLKKEIGSVSSSIYHLDGPDALQHKESVCAIENLDMIQWMPGEGFYDDDWRDLYKEIDSLGKGQFFQHYMGLNADVIKQIWDTYTSRKLFFHVRPKVLEELGY
jgi:hypothetical protein